MRTHELLYYVQKLSKAGDENSSVAIFSEHLISDVYLRTYLLVRLPNKDLHIHEHASDHGEARLPRRAGNEG